MRDHGWLYVMGLPSGPQKIGSTSDPDTRLRQLSARFQVGKAAVIKTFPVNPKWALAAERYAHWLLRDRHLQNEWFNVPSSEAIVAAETAVQFDFEGLHLIPPVTVRAKPNAFREIVTTKCEEGTWARIRAVLEAGESFAAFARDAIGREISIR